MGVEGTTWVVDWVTCDFPAQLQIVTNTARSKTVLNEILQPKGHKHYDDEQHPGDDETLFIADNINH